MQLATMQDELLCALHCEELCLRALSSGIADLLLDRARLAHPTPANSYQRTLTGLIRTVCLLHGLLMLDTLSSRESIPRQWLRLPVHLKLMHGPDV